MKIPNAKYHLSAAEKNGNSFKRVVHSVAHNRNSTIVFRIRNLLCNVPDGKHASRGKNGWKLEDMIILYYIIYYHIKYCESKNFSWRFFMFYNFCFVASILLHGAAIYMMLWKQSLTLLLQGLTNPSFGYWILWENFARE